MTIGRRLGLASALAALALPVPALGAAPAGTAEPGFVDLRADEPVVLLRPGGFLTRPSARPPQRIALDYLDDHARSFGLDRDDVERLQPGRRQRFELGLERVQLQQVAHGIPAFDGGVRATLDERGRLLALTGAPLPDLAAVPTPAPLLSADDAVERALRLAGERRAVNRLRRAPGPVRETRFAGGHVARLTWSSRAGEPRLAWRVQVAGDSRHLFDTLIDARDGSLLLRRNLVKSASGLAWDTYPGAALGGGAVSRDFTGAGWLAPGSDKLDGPNAWVYADPQDDIYAVELGDFSGPPDTDAVQIRPDGGGNWAFTQTTFPLDGSGRSCPPPAPAGSCTWDFFAPSSRDANRQQSGTQLFYFVNRFHDHLASAPGIGFTAAAGGFEGGDRLQAQVLDGIDTPSFFPDYVNNANMLPLPDGFSPRMQMYLFASLVDVPDGVNTGVNEVNGADDAAIVYHEYAHGMTNRLLCCDAGGWSLLGGPQSGAMDEGWADWYALDFLEASGLIADGAAAGEVRFGDYENFPVRFQPVDCPPGGGGAACPGSTAAACNGPLPGVPDAGPGGFTYGDFGRICPIDDFGPAGVPDGEVHADGEIWASTLWDLRSAMIAAHGRGEGIYRTRALVTGGLVLAPGFPDFLDVRDAMLAANTALGFGAADCERLWATFAARGMGRDATAEGDGDTTPGESFANPGCGAAPGGGGGGSPTPAGPRKPNLREARGRIRVSRRGTFRYPVRAAAGLRGTAVFRTRKKALVAGRRAHLSVARKRFQVGRTARVVLRIKLSRRSLRIVRRNRKLFLNAVVTVRDGAGRSASATRRLTLLAPKRRR